METGLARVTGDAGVGFGRHLVVASSALTPRAAFPSGSRAAPLPPPHAVEELHLLGRQNLRHACAQAFLLRGEPLPHLSGDPLERPPPRLEQSFELCTLRSAELSVLPFQSVQEAIRG